VDSRIRHFPLAAGSCANAGRWDAESPATVPKHTTLRKSRRFGFLLITKLSSLIDFHEISKHLQHSTFFIVCQVLFRTIPLQTVKESRFFFDEGIKELTIGLYAGEVTTGDVQDIPCSSG
jgi:hypothetical protein